MQRAKYRKMKFMARIKVKYVSSGLPSIIEFKDINISSYRSDKSEHDEESV
jgi:hypothetical protein